MSEPLENITIRKALISDQASLLTLEQAVVEAERPFNLTLKAHDAVYYDLQHLITQSDSHLVVAESNKQIIATGYAQIRDSKQSLKHSKHAYLGFMYVAPEYRGLGINKLIMESLIEWSKAQGVSDLYLDVYAENKAAIRAYEKVGFEQSLVEMKINLAN